jgi:hypothetical protein
MLASQLEAFQVVFGPARLGFYHRLQGFYRKRIASSVGRYGNPPPIRVAVALVRPFLSNEIKTVADKPGDQFSGGERPKATVVDGHGLDGDGDTGLLLGDLFDFDGILRAFGQCFPLFRELLDDHVNDFVDFGERFFAGAPGGSAAHAFKRRAVGVPRRIASGVFVRFQHHFEAVGFHSRYHVPNSASLSV